jgi:type II secretory pathway pseudopilin PulG
MGKKRGFTLTEVLFTFGILAFCLCGILLTYLQMLVLTTLSRDLTLANNAAQAKIEEVKKTTFANLDSSLCNCCACPALGFRNGCVFDITGFANGDAKGRVEISDLTLRATPTETLKQVRIVVCFKSRGRVVGEDQDLDGKLDAGEDQNGNGFGYQINRLDSPVEQVTLIAK